jgi:hypothetical protein
MVDKGKAEKGLSFRGVIVAQSCETMSRLTSIFTGEL